MSQQIPLQMSQLDPGERLLIWTFRHWVSGTEYWPAVYAKFEATFENDPNQETLLAVARLINILNNGARRTIYHQELRCPSISRDEALIVLTIAWVQAGQTDKARRYARQLVEDNVADAAIARTIKVADLLKKHKVSLPKRSMSGGHFPGLPARVEYENVMSRFP